MLCIKKASSTSGPLGLPVTGDVPGTPGDGPRGWGISPARSGDITLARISAPTFFLVGNVPARPGISPGVPGTSPVTLRAALSKDDTLSTETEPEN